MIENSFIRNKDVVSALMEIAMGPNDYSSIENRIANIMLKHYKELPTIKIAKLADLCFVDQSTISRFIKMMGFTSFIEFKTTIRNLNESLSIHDHFKFPTKSLEINKEELLQEIFMPTYDTMKETLTLLDIEKIKEVARLIVQKEQVLLIGNRYCYLVASDLQIKLHYLGKYVFTFRDSHRQYEYLKRMEKQQLCIIFSATGLGAKANDFIGEIKAKKHVLVIVSKEDNNDLKELADIFIPISKRHTEWTKSSVSERMDMLMIVDILYYILAKMKTC